MGYYGGSRVEYNAGFKAGQIVGVYLNMDMNTLKFSVDGHDHGLAFDAIKLSDADNIIGYRLAVAITHRPHKIELLESTLYNVERRSPRPEKRTGAHQGISSLGSDHRRKLSFTSMSSKKLSKSISADIGQTAGTPTKEKEREEEDVKEETPKKKKKVKKDEGGIESTSVLSPAKSKKGKKGKKGKKKKEKDGAKASKKKKKKKSDKETGTGKSKKKKKDKTERGDKPKKSKK